MIRMHTTAVRFRSSAQQADLGRAHDGRSLLQTGLISALLIAMTACTHTPSASDSAQASTTGTESSAAAGKAAQWTYPEDSSWGAACAAAPPPQQSPIDFTRVVTTPWNASAIVTQATFDSHDQNLVFTPSPGPSVSISPGVGEAHRSFVYTVAGYHFHHSNEHVTAGNPTLEIHIKTTDQYGGTAVFAALWTPDALASEDATLTAAYEALSTPPASIAAVDLSRILWTFAQQPFYSYVGSLTTPPCSRNIRWYVLQTPIRTTPVSVNRLKAMLVQRGMPANNVRSVRPLAQPQPAIYLVTPK